MAFFKPQRLEWEDIEGGVGENTIDEIWNFVYGYGEHTFDNDESLNNELSDFAEEWSMLLRSGRQCPRPERRRERARRGYGGHDRQATRRR